jgi:cob(I)alamin adenosyltransferase
VLRGREVEKKKRKSKRESVRKRESEKTKGNKERRGGIKVIKKGDDYDLNQLHVVFTMIRRLEREEEVD